MGPPQSSGGPSLTPRSLRVRVSCGTRRVRTSVLREFKEGCDRTALTDAIPLLLGAGTLNCTASPQQRDNPTPRLGVTSAKNANQCDPRASADAESARNDLPRAPCPQDILKVRPPNSLDYRARYDTPAWHSYFIPPWKNPISKWVLQLPLSQVSSNFDINVCYGYP